MTANVAGPATWWPGDPALRWDLSGRAGPLAAAEPAAAGPEIANLELPTR